MKTKNQPEVKFKETEEIIFGEPLKKSSSRVERKKKKFHLWKFWKRNQDSRLNSCLKEENRTDSPTYQSYQDLLFEDENIDCRRERVPALPLHADPNTGQRSNINFNQTGFKTEEEMAKCLAKAQMEAELDNALKQLELETRKCINRRLKKSVSYASSSIADASSYCISTTSDDRTADLTPLCSTSSDTTALSEDNGTSNGLGNGPRRQSSHRSHRHRHHSSGFHQNENLNSQGNTSNDSCESPLFDVDCPHIPSSCSHHHFDKNENTRNSLNFCGYSNSSVDSAISTSHSQSELSSPKNEFRLSFIYLKAMATLDSTRLCEGLDDNENHKNQEGESAFYEESLNLSEYSSGTSTFDSDCESDYDLPGPALHIDDTPSPLFYNSTTTVDESCASSENFNTIKSKDSFLSIRTNKYKPSDYHYTNLGSKSSSFKKSTSIDTAVSQICDIQNFSGQKYGTELSVTTKSAIRRCLSVPSIKIDTCSNRCGNCSVLKSALASLLYDCGELNSILKNLLTLIPPRNGLENEMKHLEGVIDKKEADIKQIKKLMQK